jgi:hypothetical protein
MTENMLTKGNHVNCAPPQRRDAEYARFVESLKGAWAWVCKHPGLAWALVTAFGGLILLTYLLPLGFLPDFDLSAIFGLLALASFLGCMQLVWLAGTLVAPTLMALSLVERDQDDQKTAQGRHVPVVSVLGAVVWFTVFLLSVHYERVWVIYAYVALLLIALGLAIWTGRRKAREAGWQRLNTTCRYLILFLLQGLACGISIILFVPGAHSDIFGMPPPVQWTLLGLWCAGVAAFNSILLARKAPTLGEFCAVGGALVAALILITGNLSYVHGITIRTLHLGDIPDATISVTEGGAFAIQAACRLADAPRSCAGSAIALGGRTAYAYDKVNILSRIGNQYYLQLCQPKENTGPCDTVEGLRVAVEKKEVLGWSIAGTRKSKPRSRSNGDPAAPPQSP